MKKPCPACNTIHPSNAARAYSVLSGNTFYKATVPHAPHRSTRAEAEADYCAYQQHPTTF